MKKKTKKNQVEEISNDEQREYVFSIVSQYLELEDKYVKIHEFLVKYDAGETNFKPKTKISIIRKMEKNLREYLYCLEVAALAEGINLK